MDLDDTNSRDRTQTASASSEEKQFEELEARPSSKALDAFSPPFSVIEPAVQSAPLVFSSPHSGQTYPDEFLAMSRLNAKSIRKSEDSFVDEIFADAPGLGLPFLCAEFPRAFLDVNREAFELDPLMFSDPLPSFVNTKSHRVASGLGTIARIVSDGSEIYKKRLSLADALERIDRLHRPYHEALNTLMERTHARFGTATLIDCHSMPSTPIGGTFGNRHGRFDVDVILGNRYGTSCSPLIIDAVERVLKKCGLSVVRNEPFAGGFCTELYGRPVSGYHSLQIEINRKLYMNEATFERSDGLTTLRSHMKEMIEALAALDPKALQSASVLNR